MQFWRAPSYLRQCEMEKVLRKTKQNQNRKEIKALYGFLLLLFIFHCWEFYRLSFVFVPFKDECIFSSFWRHLFRVKQWPGSLGRELSASPKCCHTNQAPIKTCHMSQEAVSGRAAFWEECFLLSPLLSPSIFLWRSPFSTVFISESYKSAPKLG